MNNKKILLVEDDIIIGESVQELLEDEDFVVYWAKDANEAIEISYKKNCDIYLFDVDIPFLNGFELLKSLRHSGDETPCIFLTAKVDIGSLTTGFDVGADDYIKKPFDPDELIIRINTQLRKSFSSHFDILNYKDIVFNIKSQTVTKNEKIILLSPTELKLFELFLKNIDKVLSKEEILYHLHDGEEGSESALRVQISKLKKLGLLIYNQRGIGYRLEKS